MRTSCVITFLLVLLTTIAAGQTTDTADTSERYFLMSTGGWGPETGTRGEGSVGIRIGSGVYSLTSLNLAGGVGAVTEDVLYRAATSRGMTLWGRAGAGVTTVNSGTNTTYTPTFGGGAMVTYDLAKLSSRLSGLEIVTSVKIMSASYAAADGTTTSVIRPMYQAGLKYNWQ